MYKEQLQSHHETDQRFYDQLEAKRNTKLKEADIVTLKDLFAGEIDSKTFEYRELVDKYIGTVSCYDFEEKTVMPHEGYVCKTKVTQSSPHYPKGMLVYINICYNCNVVPPPITAEHEIQKATQGEPSDYRIKFLLGQPNVDNNVMTISALIQTTPFMRSLRDMNFKLYLLELAINDVELKTNTNLSRQFEIPPYLSCKGQLEAFKVRLLKDELLLNVMDDIEQRKKWKLSPRITKKSDALLVIIPMPNQNHLNWEARLTENGLELIINKEKYPVALKSPIDIDNASNKIDFYKKNRTLVCQVMLMNRNQYL